MSDTTSSESRLVEKLLEIIAAEGLVHQEKLDPAASVENDLGLSVDDLTLIGNAIEREFDCDMPDNDMQVCKTVRQLVDLIVVRINAKAKPA
ncbi:acyl carrier protein [Bosea sp. BE125]|uniref:acyl carrier protein n=1 Tax=Bosea sp. BE125 TaxID=2817909 RepID=UPI00285DF8BE|nr:phosphopantetheine-binding protein [Bosea sp. BE125]MDR6873082.1 acyl carrier protein [Bosea sp. BE125]